MINIEAKTVNIHDAIEKSYFDFLNLIKKQQQAKLKLENVKQKIEDDLKLRKL